MHQIFLFFYIFGLSVLPTHSLATTDNSSTKNLSILLRKSSKSLKLNKIQKQSYSHSADIDLNHFIEADSSLKVQTKFPRYRVKYNPSLILKEVQEHLEQTNSHSTNPSNL